jgi:hypothetical protein
MRRATDHKTAPADDTQVECLRAIARVAVSHPHSCYQSCNLRVCNRYGSVPRPQSPRQCIVQQRAMARARRTVSGGAVAGLGPRRRCRESSAARNSGGGGVSDLDQVVKRRKPNPILDHKPSKVVDLEQVYERAYAALQTTLQQNNCEPLVGREAELNELEQFVGTCTLRVKERYFRILIELTP